MSSARQLQIVPASVFHGQYWTQLTLDLLGKLPLKSGPCLFRWHTCDFLAGTRSYLGMTVWVLLFPSLRPGCSSLCWTEMICMQRRGNHTVITTPVLVSPRGEQLLSSSRLAGSQTPTQPATQDQERLVFCSPIAFRNKLFGIFYLAWCFPRLPFRKRRYHVLLSVWWLTRLGPAVLLPGTQPLQAVRRVIRRVQFASGSAKGRLATPVLPSSFKRQASGLQLQSFSSGLPYDDRFCSGGQNDISAVPPNLQ